MPRRAYRTYKPYIILTPKKLYPHEKDNPRVRAHYK